MTIGRPSSWIWPHQGKGEDCHSLKPGTSAFPETKAAPRRQNFNNQKLWRKAYFEAAECIGARWLPQRLLPCSALLTEATDGGGVRGLSSLLILQALMIQINQSFSTLSATTHELRPQDVFQLAAGTSTGGLIALMLGKMGMTVDECITQYEGLSKVVFGKSHLRGKFTKGLATTRYSGTNLRNCIRKLLQSRGLDEDMLMLHEGEGIAWWVVRTDDIHPRPYLQSAPKGRSFRYW